MYGHTRARPGNSRAISTAKKPKAIVDMVTAIEGKPKPLLAAGGRTTSAVVPSSQVRARPKASAASQCAAAIQRWRQMKYTSTAAQAGASTGQSPSEASAASG